MSTPTTVYLLIGGTGELSERIEWFLRAYESEAQANAERDKLNAAAKGIETLDYDERQKAVRERLMPHDANAAVDYTGTVYYVVAIPVVAA